MQSFVTTGHIVSGKKAYW